MAVQLAQSKTGNGEITGAAFSPSSESDLHREVLLLQRSVAVMMDLRASHLRGLEVQPRSCPVRREDYVEREEAIQEHTSAVARILKGSPELRREVAVALHTFSTEGAAALGGTVLDQATAEALNRALRSA